MHNYTCDIDLQVWFVPGMRYEPNNKQINKKSQKSAVLWRAQMLETFQHYLRIELGLWLLKWLKVSLCGDLERHLRCLEQAALQLAEEMGVQLFTVITCGLGSLWAIKPHLFLTRSMGLFLFSLSTFIYAYSFCLTTHFWWQICWGFLLLFEILKGRDGPCLFLDHLV